VAARQAEAFSLAAEREEGRQMTDDDNIADRDLRTAATGMGLILLIALVVTLLA
jgi:hypothetical protein